jgi:hypothetical protein
MHSRFDALIRDIRYATRMLAVFRFVDAVIFQNLPVPHREELAVLRGGRGFGLGVAPIVALRGE